MSDSRGIFFQAEDRSQTAQLLDAMRSLLMEKEHKLWAYPGTAAASHFPATPSTLALPVATDLSRLESWITH